MFLTRAVGHYLLFEAGDDHKLLDSAVIETTLLPTPPPINWDAASPYYNLCQVLSSTPSQSSTPRPTVHLCRPSYQWRQRKCMQLWGDGEGTKEQLLYCIRGFIIMRCLAVCQCLVVCCFVSASWRINDII